MQYVEIECKILNTENMIFKSTTGKKLNVFLFYLDNKTYYSNFELVMFIFLWTLPVFSQFSGSSFLFHILT